MRTYKFILAAAFAVFAILPIANANDVQQQPRNLGEGCGPDDNGPVCKILRKASSIVKYAGNLAEDVLEMCENFAGEDEAVREFCDEAL